MLWKKKSFLRLNTILYFVGNALFNQKKRVFTLKKKKYLKKKNMLSSSSVKATSILGYTVSCLFWFPVTISGCMSLYVVGASRQGLSWFSFKHNPYLHLQLFAGAGAIVAASVMKNNKNKNEGDFISSLSVTPPKPIILLAGACWGAYAAVITKQRWHFREWRYIISAHVPLLVLLGSYLALS